MARRVYRSEPEELRRGKAFHRLLQLEYQRGEGEVTVEKHVVKPSGRAGRIDVFVDCGDSLIAVVEAKASDWDAMTEKAVRRNARRQIRQIWQYIESQLRDGREVSPGVIFARRPRVPERLKFIEQIFEDEGIPVVWNDESIDEHGARSSA